MELGNADRRTRKSAPLEQKVDDMVCRGGGGARDGEAMILGEENERVRKFDGELAPDLESEGDIKMGENMVGEVLVLWLLGTGVKEGSIGVSIYCDCANRGKITEAHDKQKSERRESMIVLEYFLAVFYYLFHLIARNRGEGWIDNACVGT